MLDNDSECNKHEWWRSYRLEFGVKGGFYGRVVHWTGDVIVRASTDEYAIGKHLFE